MTSTPPRRRRRPRLGWLLSVLALVVVFGLGVAVGEALHDNPGAGGAQTIVRTLSPLTVVPISAQSDTTTKP